MGGSIENFTWRQKETVKLGPKQAPQKGPYTVSEGKIPLIPGLTMGKPYSADIVYPKQETPDEKFPFISFAHGTGARDPIMITRLPLPRWPHMGSLLWQVGVAQLLNVLLPLSMINFK